MINISILVSFFLFINLAQAEDCSRHFDLSTLLKGESLESWRAKYVRTLDKTPQELLEKETKNLSGLLTPFFKDLDQSERRIFLKNVLGENTRSLYSFAFPQVMTVELEASTFTELLVVKLLSQTVSNGQTNPVYSILQKMHSIYDDPSLLNKYLERKAIDPEKWLAWKNSVATLDVSSPQQVSELLTPYMNISAQEKRILFQNIFGKNNEIVGRQHFQDSDELFLLHLRDEDPEKLKILFKELRNLDNSVSKFNELVKAKPFSKQELEAWDQLLAENSSLTKVVVRELDYQEVKAIKRLMQPLSSMDRIDLFNLGEKSLGDKWQIYFAHYPTDESFFYSMATYLMKKNGKEEGQNALWDLLKDLRSREFATSL
ncbi:MAG: hypothetical protein ACOYL6_17915 [Bacteriovoracaceae bacterium]